MGNKISVVINTLNEEKNIKRVIKSVAWAEEIIVCDMYSTDRTVEVARKSGAKVVFHKKLNYVEPARNFAISKASNEWVLILDSDEEIPTTLAEKLIRIASKMREIDYVRIPRKNIIFNKWMKASQWWPDYNIRFFKKGIVKWGNKIHRPPETQGEGLDLEADKRWAIVHHHYGSISEYLERLIRYTKVQAEEIRQEGYVFDFKDLIRKPLSEFLGRFFANRGFEDGLHGLSLSLLQAFSQFVVYLRLWERGGFNLQTVDLEQLKEVKRQSGEELDYWFRYINLSKNPFKRFFQKVRNKI